MHVRIRGTIGVAAVAMAVLAAGFVVGNRFPTRGTAMCTAPSRCGRWWSSRRFRGRSSG